MSEQALVPLDHDAQLVALWLHGRSPRTQQVYGADVQRFRAQVGKPVATVTLAEHRAESWAAAPITAGAQAVRPA